MKRLVFVLALCLLAAPARAHEVRPGYLELVEHEDGRVRILWKQPILTIKDIRVVETIKEGKTIYKAQ